MNPGNPFQVRFPTSRIPQHIWQPHGLGGTVQDLLTVRHTVRLVEHAIGAPGATVELQEPGHRRFRRRSRRKRSAGSTVGEALAQWLGRHSGGGTGGTQGPRPGARKGDRFKVEQPVFGRMLALPFTLHDF